MMLPMVVLFQDSGYDEGDNISPMARLMTPDRSCLSGVKRCRYAVLRTLETGEYGDKVSREDLR